MTLSKLVENIKLQIMNDFKKHTNFVFKFYSKNYNFYCHFRGSSKAELKSRDIGKNYF